MARVTGFINDVVTNVNQQLQFVDNWSALQQEYNAMGTNGNQPGQPELDAVFGAGVVTLAQWNSMLAAVQALVDAYHVPATAAKIYRFKK